MSPFPESTVDRRLRALLIVALLSCSQGCGKSKTDVPLAPPMPADVVDVSPKPQAVGVPYDTELWAQLSLPLDPSTVNNRTVFLKLDTRRVPINVRWESVSRRIVIMPLEDLALFRTHTVELTSNLHLEDGRSLDGYFWQFRTNSLRRLKTPHPGNGALRASPFVPLVWDSTETSAGSIRYHIYVGSDSAAVAGRNTAPTFTTTRPYRLAVPRWTAGATYWWAVSAENLATGETLDGPSWWFGVVPASATVDSMPLSATQWGHITKVGDTTFRNCFGPTISTGSNVVCAIDWDIAAIPAGAVLTEASLTMTSAGGGPSSVVPSIWGTTGPWAACTIGFPGPPDAEGSFGPLATGVLLSAGRLRLASDLLAAHLQGRLAGLPLEGYLLRSTATAAFVSPQSPTSGPRLLVEFAPAEPVP